MGANYCSFPVYSPPLSPVVASSADVLPEISIDSSALLVTKGETCLKLTLKVTPSKIAAAVTGAVISVPQSGKAKPKLYRLQFDYDTRDPVRDFHDPVVDKKMYGLVLPQELVSDNLAAIRNAGVRFGLLTAKGVVWESAAVVPAEINP